MKFDCTKPNQKHPIVRARDEGKAVGLAGLPLELPVWIMASKSILYRDAFVTGHRLGAREKLMAELEERAQSIGVAR